MEVTGHSETRPRHISVSWNTNTRLHNRLKYLVHGLRDSQSHNTPSKYLVQQHSIHFVR